VESITHKNMPRKAKPLDIAALKAEYDIIVATLRQVDFDKAKAARLLNVDRKTISNKLKQYRKAGLHESTQVA